jgi:hypothetical protein
MATWKKVVVSGSAAELSSVSASFLYASTEIDVGTNQTITTTTARLSGSFSGSFSGNGSGLTNITATTAVTASFATTASYVLQAVSASFATNANTLDGIDSTGFVRTSTNQTITGNKTFRDTTFIGGEGTDGKITFIEALGKSGSIAVDSEANIVIQDGAGLTLVTINQDGTGITLASGDFIGNLTGTASLATIATTASYVLNAVSSSFATTASFYGGSVTSASYANSVMWNNVSAKPTGIVSASASGTSQGQIKLNGVDVNITTLQSNSSPTFANMTVTGDLAVQGTLVTINTENLLVEDKFVLFASGSTTATDGGIIIQSAVGIDTPTGYAYGYKATEDRWAYQDTLEYNATIFGTPTAWATTTQYGTDGNRPAAPSYGGASYGYGNIWVSTDTGEVWIYS